MWFLQINVLALEISMQTLTGKPQARGFPKPLGKGLHKGPHSWVFQSIQARGVMKPLPWVLHNVPLMRDFMKSLTKGLWVQSLGLRKVPKEGALRGPLERIFAKPRHFAKLHLRRHLFCPRDLLLLMSRIWNWFLWRFSNWKGCREVMYKAVTSRSDCYCHGI